MLVSACGFDLTWHHHALADSEACAHIALPSKVNRLTLSILSISGYLKNKHPETVKTLPVNILTLTPHRNRGPRPPDYLILKRQILEKRGSFLALKATYIHPS